jgi:hypothetical protein
MILYEECEELEVLITPQKLTSRTIPNLRPARAVLRLNFPKSSRQFRDVLDHFNNDYAIGLFQFFEIILLGGTVIVRTRTPQYQQREQF